MKRSLTDRIEQYLKVLIARSDDKSIEIQRIELAETFDCVPSQVTYVISTRFTEKEGYITESRRGGCGYVRIKQSSPQLAKYNHELVEYTALFDYVDELKERQLLTHREAEMIKYLVVNSCANLPTEYRKETISRVIQALYSFLQI